MSVTKHTSKDGRTVFEYLQSITIGEEMEAFLEQLVEEGYHWERVGQQNNVGTIEMVGNPRNALIERLTNGKDGNIEQLAIEKYGDVKTAVEELPDNPRDAAKELFGFTSSNFDDLSSSARKKLAERVKVQLHDAVDEDHPTIVVKDKGIGQSPDDFVDTFVSLHGDNKTGKPYLIGRFGQGGSNTFRFANYTVIISRAHDGGDIGWTVIRRNKNHKTADGEETTAYEYLVQPDGSVPRFSADTAPDFEGSSIRLIEYFAEDFNGSVDSRLKRSNLAGMTGHLLFASVLPVRVEDFRGDGEAEKTTVKGNRALLDDSKYVDEVDGQKTADTLKVETDYGQLEVHYWVVDPSQSGQDENNRDIVKRFVDPSEPMVFTLSGQVHHEEKKRTLGETGHGFLKDRMIVEVDFDALDENRRDLVFSSTRDRAMDGEEYRHVRQCLVESLGSDPRLETLNDHYHQKAREGGVSADDANEDLADLMNTFDVGGDDVDGDDLDLGGGGDKTSSDEDGFEEEGTTEPYTPDPIPNRKEEPTEMNLVNRQDPIKVRQGGTFTAHLTLDAVDAFDDRDDVTYTPIEIGTAGALTLKTQNSLREGHRYMVFDVDSSATIGDEGQLGIKLEWGGGEKSLTVNEDIVVAEPITQSGTKDSAGTVSPKVIPRYENGEPFTRGEDSVVKYVENDGERDEIYVALFNKHVDEVLDAVDRNEKTMNRYVREYMAHIAFYEAMRHYEEDDAEETLPEDAHNRELNRYAKTLVQVIAKCVNPEDLAK